MGPLQRQCMEQEGKRTFMALEQDGKSKVEVADKQEGVGRGQIKGKKQLGKKKKVKKRRLPTWKARQARRQCDCESHAPPEDTGRVRPFPADLILPVVFSRCARAPRHTHGGAVGAVRPIRTLPDGLEAGHSCHTPCHTVRRDARPGDLLFASRKKPESFQR